MAKFIKGKGSNPKGQSRPRPEGNDSHDEVGHGHPGKMTRPDEKIGSGSHAREKVITQPSGSDEDSALAQRGMSSEIGAKFWKGSGYKVPSDVHGHHHPGKK